MLSSNFSFEKIITILSVFSKKPIQYVDPFSVRGRALNFKPPRFLYISPTFFRSYKCVENCGWCCCGTNNKPFSLDYFPHNIDKFNSQYPDLSENLKEIKVVVNGNEKIIYSDLQREIQKNSCKHLISSDRRCAIHVENPFSCRLELIKAVVKGGHGYLTKKGFGRGWIVRNGTKTRCSMGGFDEQQYMYDIELIKEFELIANYLGIETWFSCIIKTLKDIDTTNLPKKMIPIAMNIGR